MSFGNAKKIGNCERQCLVNGHFAQCKRLSFYLLFLDFN